MNAVASLLGLAAACLTALVVYELRPEPAAPDPAVASATILVGQVPGPATPPVALDAGSARLADTLLARPLFSQTRRLPNAAGSAAAPVAAATPLPRMTGILIDGPRRSALFATPGTPGGRPIIVAEGGRIGLFTIVSIEPQQVIVIGPEGRRTVRTSFDATLQPPAAPQPVGLGAPQFPGIATPGGPPFIVPPAAPSVGYGIPQSAGAAR